MTKTNDTILVVGAGGQLGSELTMELRKMYGDANVVASDIQTPKSQELRESGPFETLENPEPKPEKMLPEKTVETLSDSAEKTEDSTPKPSRPRPVFKRPTKPENDPENPL